MIRLLHFSDLHLGVETYGRVDPETGLSTRLLDFLRVFDAVIDFALTNDIDLLLFSGDAFKNRDPSPTHQREFARRIRRLSREGMPTFLLVGNHDLPNAASRAHSIEIFDTLGIEHVTVAHRPGVTRIETKRGPVQVAALPWVPLSFLVTRDEFRQAEPEQRNALLEEKLGRVLSDMAARIDDDVPAVLTIHGSIQGAVYGSERSVMMGHDLVLPKSLVVNPKYDYVALGHIHKHQSLHAQPPVVYAGSLERIDFGEAREAKGFVVAEIGDGPTRWHFHEVPTRPFVQIDVDVRQAADPLRALQQAIAARPLDEAIVKLVVKVGPEQADALRDREVRAMLADAFHIAAIVRDVVRPNRLRLGDPEAVAAMNHRELFSHYLEARQVSPEQRQRLLNYAEQLYQDETEPPGDPTPERPGMARLFE